MLKTNSPQKIAQALVNGGLSQEQLAEKLDISQPTVSRILAGKCEDTKASRIEALKKLLIKAKKKGSK